MTDQANSELHQAEQGPFISSDRAGMVKVTEVFHSLQGEAQHAGYPTVFIRLTGCPLRCRYCDSAYAFHGGDWRSIDSLLEQVSGLQCRRVCVTGGEPLAQKRCQELLSRLCDAGCNVSLETSGAIDISAVDERVIRVVDIKTPGSGEQDRNLWQNLHHLQASDQLKFVLCSRPDYEWAREQLRSRDLADFCTVWFSPSHGELAAKDLAAWILEDRLEVRLQLQLHKLLWGDTPGR